MTTKPPLPLPGARVYRGLAATVALVVLAALTGCAPSAPRVTVTVASPASTPAVSSEAPSDTAGPTDPGSPPSDDGAAVIVVTQGPLASECSHSVCHYLHVSWQNFDPGPHHTQCVTDHGDLGAWSESTYNYPSADGERDLGCFLGYAGSHVWVIVDGTLESNHLDWG